MKYFTLSEFKCNADFNFVRKNNRVKHVNDIFGLSSKAKLIYDYLYFKLKESVGSGEKNIGKVIYSYYMKKYSEAGNALYIKETRKDIASYMGMCVDTVSKYIKELASFGLLDDVRMGVNKTNRIFLKFPPSAERYKIKFKSNDTDTKEDVVESAPTTNPIQSNPLTSQAKEIITRLTAKPPSDKYVADMLYLCKDSLSDLNMAVDYNLGNPNIKDPLSILAKTIRSGYYKSANKPESPKPASSKCSDKKKSKGKFNNIIEHGLDWNLIAEKEFRRNFKG